MHVCPAQLYAHFATCTFRQAIDLIQGLTQQTLPGFDRGEKGRTAAAAAVSGRLPGPRVEGAAMSNS